MNETRKGKPWLRVLGGCETGKLKGHEYQVLNYFKQKRQGYSGKVLEIDLLNTPPAMFPTKSRVLACMARNEPVLLKNTFTQPQLKHIAKKWTPKYFDNLIGALPVEFQKRNIEEHFTSTVSDWLNDAQKRKSWKMVSDALKWPLKMLIPRHC
jgi:hypothetical protein